MSRGGSLDLDQDLAFQEASWKIQRIVWCAFLLILAGAAAGAFGPGRLFESSPQSSDGGLRLEYPRYVRLASQFRLQATIGPAAIRDGAVELFVSQSYIQGVQVQTISIEPETVAGAHDGQVYRFRVSEPAVVTLHIKPGRFGRLSGEAGIKGQERLPLSQFVYP